MLEVGVKAPDFELPDQNGKIHRLSDYAGKKVVLYFYSKDNTAYFNKTYIAKEIFPREMGKRLGRLKQERENSDYDDFYVASLKDASDQYKSAKLIIEKIEEYLSEKGIQY